jgi:amino acid transporter
MGYVLSHVFAMSGFLLLRRDRPNAERPIRLGRAWIAVAAVLLVYDIILIGVGSWSFSETGYPGGASTFVMGVAVLAIALLLYVYRVKVEDKRPMEWKIKPTPETDSVGSST